MKIMRRQCLSLRFTIFALIFGLATSVADAETSRPHVMGWIPAYGLEKSMHALQRNPHVALGLTRVGLQFWNPSADGQSVILAPVNKEGKKLREAEVRRVVAWLKARKISVLLTVYNNSQVMKHWDWDLARRAFKDHPEKFSAALLAAMQRYDLDGIDLDLEGEGDFEVDRSAYAKFVADLSRALKKQNKLLTVDSFHSPCANAPNMAWWSDWLGQVDAIHSMGYQDLYEGSIANFTPTDKPVCEAGAAIFKYSWQLNYAKKAGYRVDQILMGMPTWLDNWGQGGRGSSISAHLQELKDLGAGIALWDLQLGGPNWRSAQTWTEIRALREAKTLLKPEVKSDSSMKLKTSSP